MNNICSNRKLKRHLIKVLVLWNTCIVIFMKQSIVAGSLLLLNGKIVSRCILPAVDPDCIYCRQNRPRNYFATDGKIDTAKYYCNAVIKSKQFSPFLLLRYFDFCMFLQEFISVTVHNPTIHNTYEDGRFTTFDVELQVSASQG